MVIGAVPLTFLGDKGPARRCDDPRLDVAADRQSGVGRSDRQPVDVETLPAWLRGCVSRRDPVGRVNRGWRWCDAVGWLFRPVSCAVGR